MALQSEEATAYSVYQLAITSVNYQTWQFEKPAV